MQNGLVDYVAALNTTPGPISSPDWPVLHLHAMFIHKYPPRTDGTPSWTLNTRVVVEGMWVLLSA